MCFRAWPPMRVTISSLETGLASGIVTELPRLYSAPAPTAPMRGVSVATTRFVASTKLITTETSSASFSGEGLPRTMP